MVLFLAIQLTGRKASSSLLAVIFLIIFHPQEFIPFKIVHDHFTYLGLVIPTDPKDIFKLNFLAAIKTLKSTIEKWRVLPLSLIGRVNAIKMVALPRFYTCFRIYQSILQNLSLET